MCNQRLVAELDEVGLGAWAGSRRKGSVLKDNLYDKPRGWQMDELMAIGLESLIKYPIHGVVSATGAIRGKDGKMACLKCLHLES